MQPATVDLLTAFLTPRSPPGTNLRILRLAIAAPLAELAAVAMLTALPPALLASSGGTLS